jgi:hypothetical protein
MVELLGIGSRVQITYARSWSNYHPSQMPNHPTHLKEGEITEVWNPYPGSDDPAYRVRLDELSDMVVVVWAADVQAVGGPW